MEIPLTPRQQQEYESVNAQVTLAEQKRAAYLAALLSAVLPMGDQTPYTINYANGVLTLIEPPPTGTAPGVE